LLLRLFVDPQCPCRRQRVKWRNCFGALLGRGGHAAEPLNDDASVIKGRKYSNIVYVKNSASSIRLVALPGGILCAASTFRQLSLETGNQKVLMTFR
jgi:hypothetical protein